MATPKVPQRCFPSQTTRRFELRSITITDLKLEAVTAGFVCLNGIRTGVRSPAVSAASSSEKRARCRTDRPSSLRLHDGPELGEDDLRIAGGARVALVQGRDVALQPGVVDVDGQLDVLPGLRAERAGDGIGHEGVGAELRPARRPGCGGRS